jgi:hypothetical protein
MIGKSSSMQSNRVRGTLWLIAAFLMIVGSASSDGSKSIGAIGLMFLVFDLVALRRK